MSTGDEADGVHAISDSLSEQAKTDKKRKRNGEQQKRASKWSHVESIILLKSLKDVVKKSEAGEQCPKGLAKWEQISTDLKSLGYDREPKSVGERWDTIRQAYLHVEKHLRAGKNFAQALGESRKEFKFLPADYTDKWHALAADCNPKQKKKQGNGGAELAMVENTVAKQKKIDALPCDVSAASVSFEIIPQAFHKHIRSVKSLLSRSRDPASPSQRCDETDDAGDILRSLLSIVEAVKTNAKFEKSEPYYSLEIDKRQWKSVHDLAFNLLQDHGRRSRPTPRDANSSLPQQALERFQGLVYPQNDPDAVEITVEDIRTLYASEFLNDTIIDFYIKYLLQTSWPRERLPTFYVFNSFFFQKLVQTDTSYKQSRAAFERVKKWTKEIPIFEKDYIFIPVNQRSHWSLIIICHPGHMCDADGPSGVAVGDACILHLDSCEGTYSTGLEVCIRNYLSEEWKERTPDEDSGGYFDEMHFLRAKVPQQDNQYDCGIFLLHYVELFLKVAPTSFNLKSIRKKEPNFLRRDWFKPSEASAKRASIQRLIISLAEGRSAASLKDAQEASDLEAIGELAGTSLKCEHDTHKSGSDFFPGSSQSLGPQTRERRDAQEKEILLDLQGTVTQREMLVGSGRETPPSETHHGEDGTMLRLPLTSFFHFALHESLHMLIEDPTMCQTTTIEVPLQLKEQKLYFVKQGDALVLWANKLAYVLKDWEHATPEKGTLIPQSSWQKLCDGFYAKDDSSHRDCQVGVYPIDYWYHRDCKDGKDGMRVVEATSTSIVIYDAFDRTVNSRHFKIWSHVHGPDMDIEPDNQEMDEYEIPVVLLLHPEVDIVFWATENGRLRAYDFQNEKFIGRVCLPQLSKDSNMCIHNWKLIFSITLNMLVSWFYNDCKQHLFTWTLDDEHVERINELDLCRICDLHNDQVHLLVTDTTRLGIWDLRQQEELCQDIKYERIHDAKFSCDGELVYALFCDMSIGVFDATAGLQLRCRITPSAYRAHDQSFWPFWTSGIVAHPQKRNQLAILSWASEVLYVIEPSHELGGEWVCKANEGVGRQIRGLT